MSTSKAPSKYLFDLFGKAQTDKAQTDEAVVRPNGTMQESPTPEDEKEAKEAPETWASKQRRRHLIG